MVKVLDNVKRFLCGNVDDWKKFLTFRGETFGKVCFKHRIILGDFLSPLLFCSCCDLTNNVVKKRREWNIELKKSRVWQTILYGAFLWTSLSRMVDLRMNWKR